MDSNYSPVNLDMRDIYYNIWNNTPQRSLDYTLANLWGWQEFYGLEWRFENDLCWIRQTRPEIIHWAPLGNWHEINWRDALLGLTDRSGRHFHRVPEDLVHIWEKALPEQISTEDERGQWEYLYKQEDLATLSGSKFHKKRNHLNSYIKTYGEPDYRIIDHNLIKEVLEVQDDWCHWHECEDSPSLQAENIAVNRVLTHWDCFRNLFGGSLFVDNKMIAFSVGERLDSENLGVHFEKGLNGYKGIYQAINYEFARHAGKDFKWINRAQDLDEDGLRQAKMTYMPEKFLRKYNVVINK